MIRLPTVVCTAGMMLALIDPVHAQWGGPTKVTVATVELRDIPAGTTLVGTVEPLTRSTIGSEIAGLVETMPVRQGDFVRAGQLICQLRDDTVSLQLTEAGQRLKSLEALLRRWVYELDRIKSLYGKQDAAEKEVYDAQALHDEALFDVAEQRAVVARLETEVAKTRIKAPFAGFVVNRYTEVGQWLTLGGDVVELADLASVLVRVDVPEQAVPFVRIGDKATVKVEALDRRFEGRVRHVILQADATARTFPVEIEVRNPGYVEQDGEFVPRSLVRSALNPGEADETEPAGGARTPPMDTALLAGGMFARVTIQAGPKVKTPAVPKDAVVTRGRIDYVSMVTPGKQEGELLAVPVPVTTGVDIGDWIAVTSGNLSPGMRVVTHGNENILFPSPIVIVQPIEAGPVTAASSISPQSGSKAGS